MLATFGGTLSFNAVIF